MIPFVSYFLSLCGCAIGPDDSDACVEFETEESAPIWHADADGDGYGQVDSPVLSCKRPAGYVRDDTDCDDGDASVFFGAEEACDGLDNDCDGTVDEGAWPDEDGDGVPSCTDCDDGDVTVGGPETWYEDKDGDGYVEPYNGVVSCAPIEGYALETENDCGGDDATVYPGAPELCDGQDNDCDFVVDEDCE